MATPVDQFDATFASYTYSQRQEPFRSMLLAHEKANSVYLKALYEEYLKRYPLNSSIWNMHAKYIKATRSAEESEQVFSLAVQQNPRSHDLWLCYVSSLRTDQADDKKTYEVTERALEWIGFDYNSSIQWEDAICLQSENKPECLKLYTRALAAPTKRIDDLYEKFTMFFQYCNPEQINQCYESLFPQQQSLSAEAKIAQMKVVIDGSYQKAKQQLTTVESFEKKLTKLEYDGTVSDEEYATWKQYVTYGKENFSRQHVRFLYERALISQCDNMGMWKDYFEYLEDSADQTELLQFCRSREQLFKSMNNILLYHYAEYEELNGNQENARNIHQWATEQAKTQGEQLISRICRWIEFERRANPEDHAAIEAILENNVVSNATNLSDEIRAWGMHELSKQIAIRGDKQTALDRRIAFFEAQTYTKIAFVQLLEFIATYFSDDEQKLQEILEKAYVSCLTSCPTDQSQVVSKLCRNHLRSTKLSLNSIRAIETKIRTIESQKKLKESQAKKRKNQQQVVEEAAEAPVKHLKAN